MATFTVTTAADETYDFGTIEEETADGGGLSLREAVGLASDALGLDVITFGGPEFAGELTTINLVFGDLFFDDDIAIDGDLDADGDPDVAISGDADGDDATRMVTFAGESFMVTNAAANGADGDNSPIFFFDGVAASLNGLVLTGGVNSASGGAVASSGDLTITNSLIAGNRSFSDGGAIESSGSFSLSASAIVGNRAESGSGGAIYAAFAPLEIQSSTIADNRADTGGGLAVFGDDLTLDGVTLFGNDALSDGGAIFSTGAIAGRDVTILANSAGGEGGGVLSLGDLSFQDVTISGNIAGSDGGGVAAIGPTFDLDGAIILGNESGGAPSEISGGILNVTGASIIGLELLAAGEGLSLIHI